MRQQGIGMIVGIANKTLFLLTFISYIHVGDVIATSATTYSVKTHVKKRSHNIKHLFSDVIVEDGALKISIFRGCMMSWLLGAQRAYVILELIIDSL